MRAPALFFVGAFAMRGAGCTWNDIVDRDLDRRVERTRSRPIPAGQVTVGAAMPSSFCKRLLVSLSCAQFNLFTQYASAAASLGDCRRSIR